MKNNLKKINLNIENIYNNCKLGTMADYFMRDKWYSSYWDKNIYLYDNQQGDNCAIEFNDKYVIGVFFSHERNKNIPIEVFLESLPEDIAEAAKKGVLQYMLANGEKPMITTMFFSKNNEQYSTHSKEELLKNGGWLISEENHKEMLKRISDDNLCSDKDLEAIEEMYNKSLESNNKEINLDEQTIKLMHGKITKERIENFKNINIIINNKYLTLEENNHVTSSRKKYNLIKWITIIGITLLIIIFSVIVVIVNFNR